MKKIKLNKKKTADRKEEVFVAKNQYGGEGIFGESRRTIKELIASNGINPNPLDYMIINDAGEQVYCMSMYIEKMPLSADFAITFPYLFNFEDVTTSVFIHPMTAGQASDKLDKRILKLDSERIAAENAQDTNRYRKVSDKFREANSWAREIERGENLLYEVSFLFTLTSRDFDALRLKVNDFHSRAKEKNIELSSCYGAHPEAFVSALPLNKLFRPQKGIVKTDTVKKFILDKYSCACIFDHVHGGFSHKNGILAGRNLDTGQPFTFDTFHPSGNGYSVIIAGKTGTGKSATIKMWLSRYEDFGVQIASIDYEQRGNKGEYALMAEQSGGVSYQISANSKVVLNPYELNEEDEYDEATATDYKVLRLNDKLVSLRCIIMNIIMGNKNRPSFEDATFIESIINEVNTRLFEKRGIYEQDVESLYTAGKIVKGGSFTAGKIKKNLPTLHEFFMETLRMQKTDKNPYHDKAYAIIIDAVSDFVRELYYCPRCLKEYTKEEYESLCARGNEKAGEKAYCFCQKGQQGIRIRKIKGTRPYFDGQSTVSVDSDTIHINLDVSQLPEQERPLAQQVAMDYLNENYVKRNSMNPLRLKRRVYLIDEVEKIFPYEQARIQIDLNYRTARKRNIAVWSAMQALADCEGYKETESIINNSATIILLKQDARYADYLLKNTILTPAQVSSVIELGGEPNEGGECEDQRKGELCIICNDKVTFVKVDYLKASEMYIVETDQKKIHEMAVAQKKEEVNFD